MILGQFLTFVTIRLKQLSINLSKLCLQLRNCGILMKAPCYILVQSLCGPVF